MNVVHAARCRLVARSILAALLLVSTTSLATQASPLSLNVIDPNRTGPANTTYLFTGTVTNDTGSDLQASDIFLDFSGFDPTVTTLAQILGVPDFTIPGGTTSPVVDLFTLDLGPAAAAGNTYFADVLLQDAAGNLSDTVTVSIHVPEPTTGLLLLAGALFLVIARRRHPCA